MSDAGMAAMFTRAKNNRFKNSHFNISTNNFNYGPGQALNRLYNSTAPNAILNAGGRADKVKCHPGTRKEVIKIINKWRLDNQNNVTANQIFWLSGPAGAGKTAIVQTVAEKWKLLGIHTANFFFFRTDPSRSHAKSFVSTLLYQIFDFFPAAREAVEKVLSMKPRILDMGLEEQVNELICNTFRSIKPPFPHTIVLLVDGLDECDSETKGSQKQILDVLNNLVSQEDLPFLVLVASRSEPHILSAFKQLALQAQSVFLDDQYSPEADIRLFVMAEFKRIKTSHLHAALLPRNWPRLSDIDAIVRKSSGQFIYAATIMRFIAQPSAVPSLSLDMVQGIVPRARNSPFVHLDAFYAYILQQANDHQAIRDILSSALLDEKTSRVDPPFARFKVKKKQKIHGYPADVPPVLSHSSLPPIHQFLQCYDSRYTESLFMSSISDLSAIAQLNNGRLRFYHASLSDFLLDRSRSDQFHVNIEEFTASVLPRVWNCNVGRSPYIRQDYTVPLGMKLLDLVQNATPGITNALLVEHPSDLDDVYPYFGDGEFLTNISRLYYTQDPGSYKKILKRWITWAVFSCYSDEDLQVMYNCCEPMTKKWKRHLGWQGGRHANVIPLLGRYLFAARMRKRIVRAATIFK